MERKQRLALIQKYSQGPRKVRAALKKTPAGAITWRPAPGKWSVHEVLGHCADSEMNAAARARYLIAEERPLIVGYDQDQWAVALDYHEQQHEHCLALLDAVIDHTVGALRRAPESAWSKAGKHTEHEGDYTLETWLGIYSKHLAEHAAQIERNVKEWKAAKGATAARPKARARARR